MKVTWLLWPVLGCVLLASSAHSEKLVACEGKTMDLKCDEGQELIIQKANYGRTKTNDKECPYLKANGKPKNHDNNFKTCSNKEGSLHIMRNKCQRKQTCSIKAKNNVFGNTCDGTHKYLEVKYKCREIRDFKLPENYGCDGGRLKLKCDTGRIRIKGAMYGRILSPALICPTKNLKDIYTVKCKDDGEAKEWLKEQCNGKKKCNVKVGDGSLTDPCPGTSKYLKARFTCVDVDKPKNFACENKKLRLTCGKGKTIKVKYANYGRRLSKNILCNKKGTKGDDTKCFNEEQTLEVVSDLCNGARRCKIEAENNIFDDKCVDTPKYLEVKYDCVDVCPVQGAFIYQGRTRGKSGKHVNVKRCLKVYEEKKTHSEAEAQCKKDGGQLLVTPDKSFIKFMTRKKTRKQLPGAYWLNLGMYKGKQLWKYKGQKYDVDDEFWDKKSKQPNTKFEDRGCAFAKKGKKGRWFLGDCAGKRKFVCMWAQAGDPVFESPCPDGWQYWWNNCFRYFGEPKTYFKASKICKKRGAKLAWGTATKFNDRLLKFVSEEQDGKESNIWYGLERKNGKWSYDRSKNRAEENPLWCDENTVDDTEKGNCAFSNINNRMCRTPDSCNDKKPFVCRGGRGRAKSDDCQTGKKKCPAKKKCVDTNKGSKCVKEKGADNVCQGSGDPHHLTFDKAMIHYQGICTTTFVKPCVADPAAEGLTDFHVYHKQEHRKGKTKVSFVKEVYVDVYGFKITLAKEGVVYVDGEQVTAPWCSPDGCDKLAVRLSNPKNNNLVLTTDFGLIASYLEHKKVRVELPSSYKGKVCGICGNFNGNKEDDYFPFGESEKGSYKEIGDSYLVDVEGEEEVCKLPQPDVEDSCSEELLNAAKAKCNKAFLETEAFETCRQAVSDINTYIMMCSYDICGVGDDDAICEHLTTFADDCVAALGGLPMPKWRSNDLCPIDCGANAEYSYEASACPGTCADPFTDEGECDLQPSVIEGCTCQPGFVLSGKECVEEEQCGCKVGNKYYKRGEEWIDKECKVRSTCNGVTEEGEANITSVDIACGKNAKCGKVEGKRTCVCKGGRDGDPFVSCDKATACESNPCNELNSECKDKKNGDYKCKCKKGFKTVKGSKQKECEDIDECDKGGFCNHDCSNSYGSFTCVCNEGYEEKVKGNGKVKCKDVNECKLGTAECPKNARCKNSKGSYRCICKKGFQEATVDGKMVCQKAARCTASGDPHYKTFDGLIYDFMGGCTYTVSKPCQQVAKLPHWDVQAKNRPNEKGTVAWQQYINIDIYDQRIRIGPKNKVQIGVLQTMDDVTIGTDYIKYELPVTGVETLPGIEIKQSGKLTVFKTDFGLKVTWNGKNGLAIFVPDIYAGMLCGICGNYNGDKADDLSTAQGEIVPCKPFVNKKNKKKCKNPDIGNSWRVPDQDSPNSCDGKDIPECDPAKEAEYEERCSVISDTKGPFANCLKDLSAEQIEQLVDECIFDACSEPDNSSEMICDAMGEVIELCPGQDIKGWREETKCPFECPTGMEFSYEAPGCPDSCENKEAALTCNTDDMEGCVCPEGELRLGDKCVKPDDCGCRRKKTGQRYAVGESFLNGNCKKEFVCQPNGKFKKQDVAKECHKNAKCKVKDGFRGCHCKKGFRGDGYDKCKNINECEEPADSPDVHKCSENAICKDKNPNKVKRGYTCKCNKTAGYRGDGETCNKVPDCPKNAKFVEKPDRCNEPCPPIAQACEPQPDADGACLCKNGFFFNEGKCVKPRECGCPVIMEDGEIKRYKIKEEWRDENCNVLKCTGPNEITTKQEGCPEHAECGEDENGDNICLCGEGYTDKNPKKPGKKCKDINECRNKPCPKKSKCINVEIGEDPKGYKCECRNTGKAPVNGACPKIPKPIDDETVCEEGKENLVPYGNGICLELVEDPKKDQEDAESFCLEKGGKALTVNDKQMNNWVKKWMSNMNVSAVGLGVRRDLNLPWEGRGASIETTTCEDEVLNLRCAGGMRIHIIEANFGRLVEDDGSDETCPSAVPHDNNAKCELKKSRGRVKRECEGKRGCSISASTEIFGEDPCPGTYKMLDVKYTCTRHEIVCQDTQATLACPEHAEIDIVYANFGRRKGKKVCPHPTLTGNNKKCRSKKAAKKIKQLCKGSSTCTFDVNVDTFGDECPDTGKYLEVRYHCSDPQRGYRWVDSTVIQYSNWKKKPRLQSPKDCALMKKSGKWFQMKCNRKVPFICEYGEELPEDEEDPWNVPQETVPPPLTDEPTTEEPATTAAPDVSGTTASPDEPDTTDEPDEPEITEEPNEPDTTDEPDEDDTTDEPDEPETTDEPDEDDTTDEPDEPDEPETTDEPDEPETTDEPDEPETTDEPDEPETTDEPDEPETTDEPDAPEGTEAPAEPAPPCADDSDCDANAKCVNAKCQCNEGFSGNGAVCVEECSCRIRGDPIVDMFDFQFCMLPPNPKDKKFLLTKYRMTENDPCSLMVEVMTSLGEAQGRVLQGATMPRYIDVWFGGQILRFDQQMMLTIGGKDIALPFDGQGFTVVRTGNFVVLDAKECGVQVGFEGTGLTSIATIRVPGEYGPELTGMCGNCDGVQNDFKTADGTNVSEDPKKCDLIATSYLADVSKDKGFKGL